MAPKFELLGVAEAAERLGITRSALVHRRRAADAEVPFPNPIVELRCGPIWLLNEIDAYLEQWRAHYHDPASVGTPYTTNPTST
jgi:hypothetical protein